MKKTFRNSEKQIIKLGIFVNFLKMKYIFYTLQQKLFFLISFYSFEGVRYFCVELCIFFLHVALSNQPTVVLRHWKWYWKRTFKPYSTPLWTIAFSTVTYIDLWWSVNDLQKNALKM